MKSYKVNIRLKNGDETHARVTARNKADALRRVLATPEYRSFAANSELDTYTIEPIAIQSVDNSRFVVTTIDNKQGWYVCADLDSRIRVEWKKGRYNDTNRATPIEGVEPDPLKLATALREIGQFLFDNFNELV